MLNLGNEKVQKLLVGDQQVKAVYCRDEKIYPYIAEVQTGTEYSEWEYDLPWRTRTHTPWVMEIYIDGTTGEKVYGTPVEEKEEGYLIKEDYVYSYLNQNRRWCKEYEFEDGEVREELGVVEEGSVTFDWIPTFVNGTQISASGGSVQIAETGRASLEWNNDGEFYLSVNNVSPFFKTPSTIFTITGNLISAGSRHTTLGSELYHPVWGKGGITLSKTETFEIVSNDYEDVRQAPNTRTLGGSLGDGMITCDQYVNTYTVVLRPEIEILYSSGDWDSFSKIEDIGLSHYQLSHSISNTKVIREVDLSNFPTVHVTVNGFNGSSGDDRTGSTTLELTVNDSTLAGKVYGSIWVDQIIR